MIAYLLLVVAIFETAVAGALIWRSDQNMHLAHDHDWRLEGAAPFTHWWQYPHATENESRAYRQGQCAAILLITAVPMLAVSGIALRRYSRHKR